MSVVFLARPAFDEDGLVRRRKKGILHYLPRRGNASVAELSSAHPLLPPSPLPASLFPLTCSYCHATYFTLRIRGRLGCLCHITGTSHARHAARGVRGAGRPCRHSSAPLRGRARAGRRSHGWSVAQQAAGDRAPCCSRCWGCGLPTGVGCNVGSTSAWPACCSYTPASPIWSHMTYDPTSRAGTVAPGANPAPFSVQRSASKRLGRRREQRKKGEWRGGRVGGWESGIVLPERQREGWKAGNEATAHPPTLLPSHLRRTALQRTPPPSRSATNPLTPPAALARVP